MPIIGTAFFSFGRIKSICDIQLWNNKLTWLNTKACWQSCAYFLNIIERLDVALLNSFPPPTFFYSLPVQLYLVDSFTYAASAISAAGVSLPSYRILLCHLIYGQLSSSLGRCLDSLSHYSVNRCMRHLGLEEGILYVSFFLFFFFSTFIYWINLFFLHTHSY